MALGCLDCMHAAFLTELVVACMGVQLIVAPLRRLGINKSGTPLEQVGTPVSVLGSIGAFITGALAATPFSNWPQRCLQPSLQAPTCMHACMTAAPAGLQSTCLLALHTFRQDLPIADVGIH